MYKLFIEDPSALGIFLECSVIRNGGGLTRSEGTYDSEDSDFGLGVRSCNAVAARVSAVIVD